MESLQDILDVFQSKNFIKSIYLVYDALFPEWSRKMRADGWSVKVEWREDALVGFWVHDNGFILDPQKPAHVEILKAHQLAGTTPPPF